MPNIDMEFIKDALNLLSNNLALPIILMDHYNNEIFETQNFPFFCKIIRNQKNGRNFCTLCHKLEIGSTSSSVTCPAGLVNIYSPLIINSQKLGTIIICSILAEKAPEAIKKIAKDSGVGEDELLSEITKLKPIAKEDIPILLAALKTFAEFLPKTAFQKAGAEKTKLQLDIIHKITKLVNSSLDYQKILKQVIYFIMQFNSVDLCSITLLEGDLIKRFIRDIKEMPQNYSNFENQLVMEMLREKQIKEIENILTDSRFKSEATFNLYNSLIMIPIEHLGQILGAITVYSTGSIQKLKNDIELFQIIADQFALSITNVRQFDEIKEMAITDKLTNLYNRRYFMDALKQEVARANRSQNSLSVAMIDIDYFSHYNNINGHPAGDRLLQELAALLKGNIRATDTIGRYGGEEFIIIFPETKPNEVNEFGKRLVKAVEEHHFDFQEKQPNNNLTISLGLFTALDGSMSADEIIKEADKCLYEAKNKGRNQMASKILVKKGMNPVDVS